MKAAECRAMEEAKLLYTEQLRAKGLLNSELFFTGVIKLSLVFLE